MRRSERGLNARDGDVAQDLEVLSRGAGVQAGCGGRRPGPRRVVHGDRRDTQVAQNVDTAAAVGTATGVGRARERVRGKRSGEPHRRDAPVVGELQGVLDSQDARGGRGLRRCRGRRSRQRGGRRRGGAGRGQNATERGGGRGRRRQDCPGTQRGSPLSLQSSVHGPGGSGPGPHGPARAGRRRRCPGSAGRPWRCRRPGPPRAVRRPGLPRAVRRPTSRGPHPGGRGSGSGAGTEPAAASGPAAGTEAS